MTAAKPARPRPTAPVKQPTERPHAEVETKALLDMAAALSVTINELDAERSRLAAERYLMFEELFRRDVSYRAMSAYHPAMPSNPTISRMMNKAS